MSNSKISYRQDMPPPGGYKPFQYNRIPAKTYFRGVTLFAGVCASMAFGYYVWLFNDRKLTNDLVEERSSRLAMQPLLWAELDRAYLKQLRKNRDYEAEVMKDVPGWEVGKYFDEPVFKTRPENEWFDVSLPEYYTHASKGDFSYRAHFYKRL